MFTSVPMIAMPGGPELILIIVVILLLFGAAKLPELARGTGRALRIFKAETKGLRDDDSKEKSEEYTDGSGAREPREITSGDQVSRSQTADDPAERPHDR
jgi:sec-independent protein translocase protein TatA